MTLANAIIRRIYLEASKDSGHSVPKTPNLGSNLKLLPLFANTN